MNLSLYVWIILNVLEAGICFYLLTDIMYDMKSAGNAEKIFRVILFVIDWRKIPDRFAVQCPGICLQCTCPDSRDVPGISPEADKDCRRF